MLFQLRLIKDLTIELNFWKGELRKRKSIKRKQSITTIINKLEKAISYLKEDSLSFIETQDDCMQAIIKETFFDANDFKTSVYLNADEILDDDDDDDDSFAIRVHDKYNKKLKRACRKWDLKNASIIDKISIL